jgi:capsular exopolysaccharide synthesis family protein
MSKLFEAMEQVHRERSSLRPAPTTQLRVVPPRSSGFEAEMLTLYRALEGHLGELDQKVILFLGVKAGEGTSTVVSNLARVAAEQFDRKVVVLDTDTLNPAQHRLFRVDRSAGWDDVLKRTQQLEMAIYATADDRVSVVPVSAAGAGNIRVIDAPAIADLFGALRDRFDLVLVDCAPATVFPDSLAIGPKADGVVLVLAAESTRWPVVQNVCHQVEKAEGRVVGVVFNKRRYYIPGSIYARL